jgi:hypothetical protein
MGAMYHPSVSGDSQSGGDPVPSNLLDKDLLDLCVEQVMRCTADESLVQTVAACTDRQSLLTAMGASISTFTCALLAGSPLLAALAVAPLDSQWRSWFPPRPNSLWAELEFLRTLSPSLLHAAPLAELTAAREWVEL